MKTSYLYPYGAMCSREDVVSAEGKTVYIVLGHGKNTKIFPITIGQLRKSVNKDNGFYEYFVEYVEEGYNKKNRLYLDEFNVGLSPKYNMNYMFESFDDADDYAEWAKLYTFDPNASKYNFFSFDLF